MGVATTTILLPPIYAIFPTSYRWKKICSLVTTTIIVAPSAILFTAAVVRIGLDATKRIITSSTTTRSIRPKIRFRLRTIIIIIFILASFASIDHHRVPPIVSAVRIGWVTIRTITLMSITVMVTYFVL